MGSDEEYMDFLNKANSDVGGSTSKSAPSQGVSTSAVNTEVPSNLQSVQEYYVSDADEPFEPVALKWESDSLPSPDELAKLTGAKGKASSLTKKEFDPQGQYSKVIDLVKSAGSGDVAFFKVESGGTRAEYYVVSVADRRLVGLKAKAVES